MSTLSSELAAGEIPGAESVRYLEVHCIFCDYTNSENKIKSKRRVETWTTRRITLLHYYHTAGTVYGWLARTLAYPSTTV